MARNQLNYWLNDNREDLEKILASCKTDKDLFKALGINKTTFYRWKERSETFKNLYEEKKRECLDKIAAVKLEQAEENLSKLIMGTCYEETETKERVLNKETNEYELVTTKLVRKKLAPNVTAIIFALKNLDPEKWKDRPLSDDMKGELTKLDMMLKDIDGQANDQVND